MSEIKSLVFAGQNSVSHLSAAGFTTVFDIVRHDRASFLLAIPDIDVQEAENIYCIARQRAESLKSLFRSWQLRQEPGIASLKKLSPSDPVLNDTLQYHIGSEGDFSDLMARSSQFADAASIQSLFSPGRYAASLYAVAKKLHPQNSPLSIHKRRPDLEKLILSEATLNQEVTSLDILLDVLHGKNSGTLTNLSHTFFPMTLPYDDALSQIEAALEAQGRTLNGIWDQLADTQKRSVAWGSARDIVFSEHEDNRKGAEGVGNAEIVADNNAPPFYLKANGKMVWVANASRAGSDSRGILVLGEPEGACNLAPLQFALKKLNESQRLFLGISGDLNINNVPLTNTWLKGTNGQQGEQDGRFAAICNRNKGGWAPGWHHPVTMKVNPDGTVLLLTPKGYIGYDSKGGQANWKNPLVLDVSREQALSFTLCADEGGVTALNPLQSVPPEPLPLPSSPNPSVRTTLSLTPVSYQLMVKKASTREEIATHYGLAAHAAKLHEKLNDIGEFCKKTGLTFNDVLSLTAQDNYTHRATLNNSPSAYYEFDLLGEVQTVHYGARYLNTGYVDHRDDMPLWVQPEKRDMSGNVVTPAALNFVSDTVVMLAERAEKLIRLRNTTGLSFEALDWMIQNASKAAGSHRSVIDASVLRALASCVELQARYGVSPDVVVSFIGRVNLHARHQEKSLYERLFTYTDQTRYIPVAAIINYARGHGKNEAACCAALGVTGDEFARIGRYCFGENGTFKMISVTAGQIYRFGAIPRMLGMSFAEAECLWTLMSGDSSLLFKLGLPQGFAALDIIRRTEQVLAWMTENNLNLLQLQAMVSPSYSCTATAEMFTFLQNVYRSVTGSSGVNAAALSGVMDGTLRQKLLRTLAGGYGIKTNIAGPVTDWLAKTASGFTLDTYWSGIQAFFGQDGVATVDTLQERGTELVLMTQRLSQLVVIVRWLDLSQQDLELLTITPTQLSPDFETTPSPSLYLILLLSRLKGWQSKVTTGRDEALRLLPFLATKNTSTVKAVARIAAIHNLSESTVMELGKHLFGKAAHPKSFEQLWLLLSWARTGQALNVDATTLGNLMTMAKNDDSAEKHELIAHVARSLTAGLTR